MNIEKLIQVVNYLLKKYDYSLNYTKLIKLLYLADRECIKQSGWNITSDSYKNFQYGPVLTNLYTLIKGKHDNLRFQSKWDSCFLTDSNTLKAKTQIIPEGELSDFEKEILDDIDSQYHSLSYSKMIDIVHDKKICPEWSAPIGYPTELTKQDIMRAIGFDETTINYFLQEEDIYSNEQKIFDQLEII